MTLTPEQIQSNWDQLLGYIETDITGDRKDTLLSFYKKYEERLIMMPAAHKKEYHNAFPGGYVDHVNRVVECAIKLYNVWCEMEVDRTTFTLEELIFSAINHDLGKMGDENYESYIPQTDQWRRDKLGEDYMFNKQLAFSSVPDRGLFLLQSHGISYTFNEMIAIQTHDGLYDDANKKYLMAYMPEQKPRTSLPYIIHQADMMAARIEFEKEWLPKFKENKSNNFKLDKNSTTKPTTKAERKTKTLANVGNKNGKMNSVIDDFFA
jgi:hypothetical protein